jgi:hypothetical protein
MLYFVMHIMIFYYFSEKKSFTVYTYNNISTHHMFPNKLNFKLKAEVSYSEAYIEIFLTASNPSVFLGDMYYIQLQKNYYQNRIQKLTLMKCTSNDGGYVTIHGNQRFGCESIKYNVSISVNFKLRINLIFLLLEVMCPDKFIT